MKTMKKWNKLIAVLTVCILCVGTAFTSFAADTPDAPTTDEAAPAETKAAPAETKAAAPAETKTAPAETKAAPADTPTTTAADPADTKAATAADPADTKATTSADPADTKAATSTDPADTKATTAADPADTKAATSTDSGNTDDFANMEIPEKAYLNSMEVKISDKEFTEEETKKLEEEAKDALKNAYVVGDKDEIKVLFMENLESNGPMPADGVDVQFYMGYTGVAAGNTVYVLHKLSNGTWEIFEAEVRGEKGSEYIKVHLTSLSPVAVLKVTSDGKVKKLVKKDTGKSTVVEERKSPKTGEF